MNFSFLLLARLFCYTIVSNIQFTILHLHDRRLFKTLFLQYKIHNNNSYFYTCTGHLGVSRITHLFLILFYGRLILQLFQSEYGFTPGWSIKYFLSLISSLWYSVVCILLWWYLDQIPIYILVMFHLFWIRVFVVPYLLSFCDILLFLSADSSSFHQGSVSCIFIVLYVSSVLSIRHFPTWSHQLYLYSFCNLLLSSPSKHTSLK